MDIDGNFKLSLEVNDDYNEFLINVFDENHNLVEIDENSTNSISYKRAINPGCNILPSSINLYLDEDSSLALKNNDESIDLESQIEFVKDYSRKFNSSHVIAFKGEKIPIERKEIAITRESIENGNENSFIKLSFYSGELILANYNTFLGEILIDGDDIIDDLPKGSEIELNISIDESNLIDFEVFIPYLRQSFTNSFSFNNYSNYNNFLDNYDNLRAKYDEIIERYNKIRDFTLNENNPNDSLERVFENIQEIEDRETISYLDVLIDMAKYDKIAVYPSLEYLNYLNDVLDECKFFFSLANVNIDF